jgi:molybdopterin biosynthesis enzyme
LVAEAVETGASGAITTLAKADGFLEIPENEQFVDADEEVTVWLLKESLKNLVSLPGFCVSRLPRE